MAGFLTPAFASHARTDIAYRTALRMWMWRVIAMDADDVAPGRISLGADGAIGN